MHISKKNNENINSIDEEDGLSTFDITLISLNKRKNNISDISKQSQDLLAT
tara:strand:+ start:48 stop:200 length:153 start_codon:yes stop_codon:yes gene_type:complete